MLGTVKWFNSDKGFGFIKPDDNSADCFAHFKNIVSEGFKTLQEGDRVEFNIAKGVKGMEAHKICVIRDDR